MLKKKSAFEQALSSLEQSHQDKAERSSLEIVLEGVQQEIVKNPWTFLGKVAIGSFGLGLALGHHSPFGKRGKK